MGSLLLTRTGISKQASLHFNFNYLRFNLIFADSLYFISIYRR
jgi:hypothetical protein